MNSRYRTNRIFLVSLAAMLAVALFSLAWPRMKASYRFLPVDLAIDRYYQDREIPSHRMLTLIKFAREAIENHDQYRYHAGLSFLHYLRAIDIRTPALERRDAYRQAEAEAVETVKRAPAQPESWLRIATVRFVLHDEADEVLEPWRMSIFTGRTHSTLMVPRSDIGLAFLEVMDAETRAMLRDQLMLAWALKPQELVAALQIRDPRLEKVRSLVDATHPAAVTEMEMRLEKAR